MWALLRNANVSLGLIFTVVNALAQNIVSAAFFPVYLDAIAGDETVGFVTAASGGAMVLLALPVGLLTDRWSRSKTLKIAAVVGLLSSTVYFLALWLDSLPLMYVASAMYGAFAAVNGAPLAAIIADSLPSGRRTNMIIVQYALGLLASAGGPAVVVLFYWRMGDTWNQDTLKLVLHAGNAITVASCAVLVCFDDKKTLGASSESLVQHAKAAAVGALQETHNSYSASLTPDGDKLASEASVHCSRPLSAPMAEVADDRMEAPEQWLTKVDGDGAVLSSTAIPATAAVAINSSASALTHRHAAHRAGDAHADARAADGGDLQEPLLLRAGLEGIDEHAAVASTQEARIRDGAVSLAVGSGDAGKPRKTAEPGRADSDEEPRTTRNLGHQRLPFGCCTLRVRHIPLIIFISDMTICLGAGMTVAFFSIYFKQVYSMSPFGVAGVFAGAPVAIALLSLLAVPLNRVLGRAGASIAFNTAGTVALFVMSIDLPMWLAVGLYMLRTAAMNAGYPTQRAIMMDVVEKRHRGKWSALENVSSFTWTGSAALGGVLVDKLSFDDTFRITGGLFVLSTLMLLPLVPLTWGEIVDDNASDGEKAGVCSASIVPADSITSAHDVSTRGTASPSGAALVRDDHALSPSVGIVVPAA
jgi:MFS family permease